MNNKKPRLLIGMALLLIGASAAYAGNRSGIVTAQFLKLPTDARSTAIGNAQVALARGAMSIANNPAGVLSVGNVAVGGTYNQWYADITHSFMAAAANLGPWGTVGAGFMVLTTDDMVVTTPAFPEGTGELFKASEYAFSLSYGLQISEEFGIGITGKYIQSNLFNDALDANSFAVDIGSLYDMPMLRTRLGISVNNLGKDMTYINEQYSLPTALRFGARTTVLDQENHLLYAVLQVARPNDADEVYNLGAEYVFNGLIALRAGYKFNYDTENWSGGLGLNLASLGFDGNLDYAYTNYKWLPGTHMFTAEVGF
ncbi:MAG: PorV/PorQ family protein [Ignavibacteria bacterium]|nr:PorV/PorQ family protein [Ignavibacteria bacterium]